MIICSRRVSLSDGVFPSPPSDICRLWPLHIQIPSDRSTHSSENNSLESEWCASERRLEHNVQDNWIQRWKSAIFCSRTLFTTTSDTSAFSGCLQIGTVKILTVQKVLKKVPRNTRMPPTYCPFFQLQPSCITCTNAALGKDYACETL